MAEAPGEPRQVMNAEELAAGLDGQCIRLVNDETGFEYPSALIVKRQSGAELSLALSGNPISHLLVTCDSRVYVCGAAGAVGAVFVLTDPTESPEGTVQFSLKVLAARSISDGSPMVPRRDWMLGVHLADNQSGKNANQFSGLALKGNCKAGPMTLWRAKPAEVELGRSAVASTVHPECSLSAAQRRQFAEQGYLLVRDVMPDHLVQRALDAIHHTLDAPDGRSTWDQTEGKASQMEEAVDLWAHSDSPALTLADSLLGEGRTQQCVRRCQIALRFGENCTTPEGHELNPREWHVDGTIKGAHSPFSLLLGVALSDVPEDCPGGGFVCFPGTHLSLQQEMRAFAAGEESIFNKPRLGGAKTALEGAVEIKAKRGDVLLAHQKLAHTGGPNNSDKTRYAVYFRISHLDHENLQSLALEDPMLEFEGCREASDVL